MYKFERRFEVGPNDAQLVRVFTREAGGAVSDTTALSGKPFEIVVEAEVGSALHNTGGKYEFGIVVRDLTTTSSIHTASEKGNFGPPNWPGNQLAKQFVFPLAAAKLTAAMATHILEVIAYLKVGGVGTLPADVSFAKSSMFIVE